MNTHIVRIILAAIALNLCACTSFDREWSVWSKQTPTLLRTKVPPPTTQSPFDGRWVGTWTSERHHKLFSSEPAAGSVRCVFTKMDPYRYRAHFRATWMNFRTDHLATLSGKQRGKTVHLHGTESLSKVFGSYRYDGTVTPTHFSLRYDSRYDSGTMEMRKVR
jgi:hypothetical protein